MKREADACRNALRDSAQDRCSPAICGHRLDKVCALHAPTLYAFVYAPASLRARDGTGRAALRRLGFAASVSGTFCTDRDSGIASSRAVSFNSSLSNSMRARVSGRERA